MNKMELNDWNVDIDEDKKIHVVINDNVNIDGLSIILLSEKRTLIQKIDIDSRNMQISCEDLEMPIFAQINHSVKYVLGSGGNFYKDILPKNHN